ncbi:centriole, cilia and spindle-associated protein-like isoform X2 [Stegostoma tigrinum]|uniref:centriole, cilia and spindle-associated protein-like isoform X2 n=1 Tax=Stegostoma tigrinum TaxID=3053191 RepID=UPI00286FBAE6|nr:centriole, cilia and spindle-associated protein-like isoform X2 [Stegostoma tigrinum]
MAKRMKSEYMKQFQGPSWEVYGSCYLALLEYRSMRRLLEQAHVPWIWDPASESGSGSSSGCSTPSEPAETGPQPQGLEPAAQPLEPPAATGAEDFAEAGEKVKDEEPTGSERRLQPEASCRVKRTNLETSPKAPQPTAALGAPKETKAPFAMFGWAERDAEIYESAVRAHDRRQVQKAMRTPQRRPRAKVTSTTHLHDGQCKSSLGHKSLSDHLKVRVLKPVGAEDPWLSEYMRCYSSRSL